MNGPRIAAILMAAGDSRRLGQPKQLLEWEGVPLIEHVARTALEAGLHPVVVVIGYRADEMRAALRSTVTVVENPDWPQGMSTSLRAGLQALPADVDAAVMLLVDQPRVGAEHLRAMIDAYRQSGKPMVTSGYQGRRSSPALFDRSLFDQLMMVTGDSGGRSLIQAQPDRVVMVEAPDEETLIDVDTLNDWRRVNRQFDS